MADVQKMARDSLMLNGTTPYLQTGASRYDEGLKKQYFADQTRFYTQQMGEIASNVYDAQCQGIGSGDWYDWTPVQIRVSPAAVASTGETMPDDWQKLHIIKPVSVDTVPIGAYLNFAGSTWIVYKGRNMGSVIGDGIIRRCNSVINVLDYYGNIVSVPMSYAKMATLGNASHATENSIVAKNYISCVCQLNQYSAAFAENTRIILGKTAYSMRGLNDFTREFTNDQDSVHLLTFTIERSAPLPQDSIEKQCADYGSFDWKLNVIVPKSIKRGGSAQIQVISKRMGETVESTEEHPISYVFSGGSLIDGSVDENGVITINNFATIGRKLHFTVSLAQNPEISESFTVTVVSSNSGKWLEISSVVPEKLSAHESFLLTVVAYNGGSVIQTLVTAEASGPPASAYSIETVQAGVFRVTCYMASSIPLKIKLSAFVDGNIGTETELMLTA